MKSLVTVVGSDFTEKHYEKSVSQYFTVKLILQDADDADDVDVGTMRVKLDLVDPAVIEDTPKGKRIRKGDYLVDFKAGRSYSDDGIVGRCCEFVAFERRPDRKEAKAA